MDVKRQVHDDYIKGMKYKEIADKYGISVNTIKSWKQRNNWQRKLQKKGASKAKKGAPFCNMNAVGNQGGPGGPERNHKAVTHGLFAKYLPPETNELVHAIENKSPIDILWDTICIKYAAILRAQKIMYVDDKKDFTVRNTMKSMDADAYQYTEACEKQASFLIANGQHSKLLNKKGLEKSGPFFMYGSNMIMSIYITNDYVQIQINPVYESQPGIPHSTHLHKEI